MKLVLAAIMFITSVFVIGILSGTPPGNRIADITLPPVATFNQYCVRCHGYEGSAYGRDFANIREDSLNNITEDMMFGPAGLNPDSISIAAMVAYNRALSKHMPFAAVMNGRSYFDGRDTLLFLEASPAAAVEGADSTMAGTSSVSLWRMHYDKNKGSVRITVTRNGVSSQIRFPDELWSR